MSQAPEWDVFISYSSEDRSAFVQPLVQMLAEFGVQTWWDQFELEVGDSLSRSIDRGLSASRFGVLVISSSFLAKRWPEYELRGLVARELAGGKVILPIWYGVTVDQVLEYSPSLADKKALTVVDEVSETTVIRICVALIEIVRPDLLTRIHRKVSEELAQRHGERVKIPPSEMKKLKVAPPRHAELPPEVLIRIRLVRAALLGVYGHSMEFWVRGFLHDAHPTREVEIWERLAAAYLEYVQYRNPPSSARASAFKYLLSIINGAEEPKLLDGEISGDRDLLRASVASLYPVVDTLDEDIHHFDYETPEAGSGKERELDVETFPDIPQRRIRQLADLVQDSTDKRSARPT